MMNEKLADFIAFVADHFGYLYDCDEDAIRDFQKFLELTQ